MKRFRTIGCVSALCCSWALGGCSSDLPELEPLPPISEYQPSDWDMERYRADLDAMVRDYNIVEPGDFSIVRWINPEDSAQVMGDCLASLGFPVTVLSDGYEVELPPGQEDPFNRARYQCVAQYPTRYDVFRPLSAEEVEVTYRHLKDVYIPCMEDKGYPDLVAPSFEAYKAEAEQGRSGFDPHDQLAELYPELGLQEISQIIESCPQYPVEFRAYPTE